MSGKSNDKLAVLAIAASGVLWGFISLFIHNMTGGGMTLRQIVFVRALGSIIILGGLLAIHSPESFKIRLKDLWMFIGSGIVSMFCFNLCYFYTVAHNHAAVGGVLLYTSPISIILLSALLFKEKITLRKMLALVMMLAGCVLISGVLHNGCGVPMDILGYGLLAGFLYGLYSIFCKFAVARYSSMTITFYTFAMTALACACCGEITNTVRTCVNSPSLIPWMVAASIVSSSAPYTLYTWGLKHTTAGRASILVAVEPLVCAIMGICVYGEPCNVIRLVGFAAVLGAILLLGLEKSND